MPPPLPPRVPGSGFAPPPERGSTVLLWIAIVFVVISVSGLGGLAFYNFRKSRLPARENVSAADKHRETRDAFSGQGPQASPVETSEITAALDRFNAVIGKKTPGLPSDVFDADRLADELDRLGVLASVPGHDDPGFRRGFEQGLNQAAATKWAGLLSTSRKIKKIKLSDNSVEAVVYDIDTRKIGGAVTHVKMRWWLRKSALGWRVWDFESMEEGLRASTLMGAIFSGGNVTSSPLVATVQQFQTVFADGSAGNWSGAEATLRSIDRDNLPPELQALKLFFWALVHSRQARYAEVLKDCDAIAATGQDVPSLYEFRTEAFNHLGQYQAALTNSLLWEDTLGGDLAVYYQRGVALKNLKRGPEAAAMFEKSLDEDADAAGSLEELSAVLPAEDKSELTRRFAKATKRHAVFKTVANHLQVTGELSGMQTLIEAYRSMPESARDPWFTYYDAELHVIRKQYQESEALLKTIQSSSSTKGQENFASEYYYAAMLAGDSIAAYNAAEDRMDAFQQLSRRLLSRSDTETLSQLVTAHLASFSRDPLGYYYQAKLLQISKHYGAADTAYAKALSYASQKDEPTFRRARVYTRFLAGTGLSAYTDLKPKDQVFSQLAGLFYDQEQGADLAKLVELRRADAPGDSALPLWDAKAKFLARDYPAVLSILAAHPATERDSYIWQNLYVRSQVRLNDFGEARTLLNAADDDHKNWWLIAMVECAAGNVTAASHAIDQYLRDEDNSVAECYADPDMGPALKSPAFAPWRTTHPMPSTSPADSTRK